MLNKSQIFFCNLEALQYTICRQKNVNVETITIRWIKYLANVPIPSCNNVCVLCVSLPNVVTTERIPTGTGIEWLRRGHFCCPVHTLGW